MKVLMLCDVRGNLGDAIRIQKIAERIAKTHTLKIANASGHYRPKRALLTRPKTAARMALSALSNPSHAALTAYGALLRDVLKKELQGFAADAVVVEGVVQAGFLAESCPVPLVTDVHGLASAEYAENPFHKVNAARTRFLEKLERTAFEKSAQVWAVSEPMRAFVAGHGGSGKNTAVVRNGADVRRKTATFKKPLSAAYGGIFAFWEDVDAFLDLAKKGGGADFHLAGGGPLLAHVKSRIHAERINLSFHGSLTREKSLELFSDMQVGVAPSVDALTRRVASPIKVFDYLACGLPVVTPKVGEWADIVLAEDAGVVTEKSSGGAFVEALWDLSEKRVWMEKSENAKNAITKRYNWNQVLNPVDASLAEAAGKKGL